MSIPDIFESSNEQELPLLQWVTLHFKQYTTYFISRDTRQLHQIFLWKVYGNTLTLREREKEVEVFNPDGNDPQGPDLEKPLCNWELAQREQMPWGQNTVHKRSQCQKEGSLAKCMLLAIISSDMARRYGEKKKENSLENCKYKFKSQ